MSEEFFPQKRKPDLNSRIAEITNEEGDAEPQIPQRRPMIDPALNPDGVQVTGKIPAAMIDALNKKNMQMKKKSVTNSMPKNDLRITGSSKLEELISGIYNNSNIYEEITLPSMGKFYNGDDGPINGILHIRPMTGEEEQILATPRFVKKGQAINMIFNKCIKERYNNENFLTQDRTYLLIYLRGISYTPEYEVEVKCPLCDRRFAHNIDLNSLIVNQCPHDFNKDKLTDILPTTGYKFSYKLSCGADENTVQQYRDNRIKEFDLSEQADDTLIYRTSMLINDIEGLSDKLEIRELLKKLPVNDVAYIRTMVNEPPFGVDTKILIPCLGCNEDFEIDLPLEANFFFPKAKKKKPA